MLQPFPMTRVAADFVVFFRGLVRGSKPSHRAPLRMFSMFPSGCRLESAQHSRIWRGRSKVEIGLWVPNGKIWVKGFALTGVVSRTGPASGVRVHFEGMTPGERDSLRQFLKFVQDTTRASQSENSYLQALK